MTNSTRATRRLAPLAAAALAFGTLGAGAAVVTATPASAQSYDCPGGMFCGYDGANGTGSMIVQVDNSPVLHDIGNGGVGDRLTSYWNRTGKAVNLYDWTGQRWLLLATIADNGRGTLASWADNRTDAVEVLG